MMNFKIICVGKKHSIDLSSAIADYQSRLLKSGYKISWQIIPSGFGEQATVRSEESGRLLQYLKKDDFVILLDNTGQLSDNSQFSVVWRQIMSNSQYKQVVFIIGGAYGVSDDLKDRANYVWSLSKLVFPHQLVRLILLEQLYRTHCILHQHPYHHQ